MSIWQVFLFALFAGGVVLSIDLIKWLYRMHQSRKAARLAAAAYQGQTILNARLLAENQQQLRRLKEREAADQYILDQAEEARRDFE